MNMEHELSKRKDLRLKNYDYSATGAYYITICTQNRKRILSEIVKPILTGVSESTASDTVGDGALDVPQTSVESTLTGVSERMVSDIVGDGAFDAPQTKLTPIGKIVEKYLLSSESIPGVKIDQYVIMPDHIHVIIFLDSKKYNERQSGTSKAPSPTSYNERQSGTSRAPSPTSYNERQSGTSKAPSPTSYNERQSGTSRAPSPTNEMLPHIVSTFKRFCNREIGTNIFQRSYIEHVIRDKADYEAKRKYIYENPIRWYYENVKSKE